MPSTTTSNFDHIALDGPIGLSVAVVLGLALLGLFAWALSREREILGPRYTLLFWALRSVALATVIWMLLAPMNVRVETSTTRRAVAIVTDVSGSMRTVDPPGTSDDLRWAVSGPEAKRYTATRSADQASAAVGIARRHLSAAAEALRQHKPESLVVASTTAAAYAFDRTSEALERVRESSVRGGKAYALADRLKRTLEGSEFLAYSQLAASLEKGRTPSQIGWRESLPDLEHRVAGLTSSLHELSRHAAEEESQRVAKDDPQLLTSVRRASRLDRAAGLVGSLQRTVLSAIQDKADIRWSAFDQSVQPLADPTAAEKSLKAFLPDERTASTVSAVSGGTNISGVLEQLNRDRREQPIAAVFLFSDVSHNQPGENYPRDAAAMLTDTPIYVVPMGNSKHVRDVVLQAVHAPAVVMRNDDIVIEARVQAYDCGGEVCTVQLRQDGEVIDFREVRIDTGLAARTVRFEQHLPSIGPQTFEVVIVPLEGELSEDNNEKLIEVNVTRSDIKVLLADELPRWEYRYLAQLFRRDPKVDCDELLYRPRMIATGRRAETKTFPVNVDDWDRYDVIMLGDLSVEHLPVVAQETLIEYLRERGGTLVMIAGSEHMPQAYVDHPIEDILPVRPIDSSVETSETYAFRVTEDGRDHHALMIGETPEATRVAWDFVNRFSPLHAVSEWRQPLATSRTLIAAVPRNAVDEQAAAASSAFLCWQPVGRGRIVYLSGPDTYRLRFLRGDRLHYRFWGQLLRWAIASDLSVGSKFVRIRTDKSRYLSREAVQVTVQLTDTEGAPVQADDVGVRILSGGEDERSVPLTLQADVPGEYVGSIRALPPGEYRVEPIGGSVEALQEVGAQDAASAGFTVQADVPMEMVDTRSDRALAQQIADLTGGQSLPPTAVEEILALTNLEPIVSERIETRPMWLEWKYLWIVFGCLQTEWIIRKWKGLS